MLDRHYSIGVDVGGTKIAGVLFGGETVGKGRVLADYALGTPHDNFEHFLIMLTSVIDPLLEKAKKEKAKVRGVGLGVAGMVNRQNGKVLKAPNLPYLDKVDLVGRLEKKIGLPVKIDNDASCFLRAEARIGAGKNFQSLYGVTIGTGIGGAWWVNKNIYEGLHGVTGEPGHVIVDYKEAADLEDIYKKLMQNNPAQLAGEAYSGDLLAEKSYEEFGRYMGIAFANIVNLIDPEAIVIGGGVVESSDLFFSSLKKSLNTFVLPPANKKIRVLKSKLGRDAGAIGAALLIS